MTNDPALDHIRSQHAGVLAEMRGQAVVRDGLSKVRRHLRVEAAAAAKANDGARVTVLDRLEASLQPAFAAQADRDLDLLGRLADVEQRRRDAVADVGTHGRLAALAARLDLGIAGLAAGAALSLAEGRLDAAGLDAPHGRVGLTFGKRLERAERLSAA